MSTIKKTTLAILALGAGMAVAPSLYAQGTSSGPPASQMPGMSGGGGMMGGGGMSGDMAAMMKMMENCSRMMQTNSSPQGPSVPPGTPPATPGQKG